MSSGSSRPVEAEPVNRPIAIVLAVASLLAAGCIQAPEDLDSASAEPQPLPDQEGTMTGEETTEESSSLCLGSSGVSLPDLPVYCAKRTVTVTGEMTLSSLPVAVSTGFADVALVTGEEGTWSLVAEIEAAGATEDIARANLAAIGLAWSIGPAGEHFLEILQDSDETSFSSQRATILVTLPASPLYDVAVSTSSGDAAVAGFDAESLVLSSSSGDLVAEGVEATALSMSTSSGDVGLKGEAFSVSLDSSSGDIAAEVDAAQLVASTSSGDIGADVRTIRDGAIALDSSSGDIVLKLVEDDERGYDLVADTSSGDIQIELQDGDLDTNEDGDEAAFVTDGYSRREIRTSIAIDTSSGDIAVGA